MGIPRPRVTLLQALAAVAVLTPPLALYAARPLGGSRPLSGGDLITLLCLCVEVEALVWLVLIPAVHLSLGRWRRTFKVTPPPLWDRSARAWGPCIAVLLPVAGWSAGYRLPGALELKFGAFLLAVGNVPLLILLAVLWSRASTPLRRSVTTVSLLLLTIPCIGSLDRAEELGRRRLEREVDIVGLARDCQRLVEAHDEPMRGEIVFAREVDRLGSAAIQRLRPRSVQIQSALVRIELHGGFEHYGYQLEKDKPNGRWVFEWYNVDGAGRQLLSWPIGTTP
jgi:hypothetical protein